MRSEILIFTPVLVFLSSLCVNGILYNGTGVRKSKPMNVPTLKIKIVEKATSLPKVSAKIIGNGNPIPKIMARIYHGPKSKQMFRRRFHTQPTTINHQPYYYRRTKFPPIRNISPQMQHHHLAKPINSQGINQPYFRGPSLYPTQLHFTTPNELESNHLSDNSIIRPTSPKGYLPVNNFQTDYLKLFEDINSNENDFLGGRHQSNFPKLSQYGNSVRQNPIIPAVPTTLNQESQSIQLEFHEPHNIAPDKIHPNLSEEAKRYIEFMASGDYFLPKVHPDYRKIFPSTQNYYVSQTKYLEQQQQQRPQSQELYIPLSQRKPPPPPPSSSSSSLSSSSSSSSELSRNRSPEKIEFTEKDAIHSHPQYNRSPVKDPEIDIRGRFVGNSIFAGRKKEYDDTRGSESFLSEGVVKESLQDFKGIPGNDGRMVTGEENVHNEIIKVPGYTETEFCDKKCSDSDNDSRDNIDLLCGTDRITYYNEAQLLCIVSCTNAVIDIDYRGPCIQSRE